MSDTPPNAPKPAQKPRPSSGKIPPSIVRHPKEPVYLAKKTLRQRP